MASRSKITEGGVVEFPDRKSNEACEDSSRDPTFRSHISVTLDQLRPYDNNPRQSRNPNFDAILTSIENRGLDHAPNISLRNPTDPYYIIIDGGNTRLEILNILYEKYSQLASEAVDQSSRLKYEKRAEGFYRIGCVCRPWVSESDSLAGHMSENEDRGELLFIERALAVQRFRSFYQAEDKAVAEARGEAHTVRPLSVRALAERITKQGWTVSYQHINRYDYAATRLSDVIPNALWAGAGEPLVRNLRRHEKAYLDFWNSAATSPDEQSNNEEMLRLFYGMLSKYDGESVDLDGFVAEINGTLGEMLSIPYLTVCAEIDAWLAGRAPPKLPIESPNADEVGPDANSNNESDPSNKIRRIETKGEQDGSSNVENSVSCAAQHQNARTKRASDAYPNSAEETECAILAAARSLATPLGFTIYGVEASHQHSEERLYTFAVAPVDQPFQPQDDNARAAVWWALFRLSRAYKTSRISSDNVFRQAYKKYLDQCSEVDTLLALDELLVNMPDKMYSQLLELQQLIRHYNQFD